MPRGLIGKLGFFEAIMGLVCACLLALGIVVGGIFVILWLVLYERRPPPPYMIGLLAIGWALVSIFQIRSVQLYAGALDFGAHPLPVHVAMQQPVRSAGVRPLVALWWLLNAATLLVMSHALATSYQLVNPATFERVIKIISQVAVLFGGAVASNTYLLLAVHSVVPTRRAVEAAWRLRIVIDIGLVLASFALDDVFAMT